MKKGKGKKQIQFDKALISSYTHPIAPKEVIERLTLLHTELSGLESVDPKELDSLNKEFMNTKLINNINLGVQTMLLCCITDTLRLYAPNCPYNTSQLTKIFSLIISNLKQLGKSSNKFQSNQIEYLENLSNSNSIVLISETDNPNDFIEAFFEISYSAEIDEALDPLVNCMNLIIQTANNLSTTTLHLIFYDKSFDTISVYLLKENSSKFSRLLIQLFSDRINSKQTEEDRNDEKEKLKSLKHLKKFHSLLVKLWSNTPECLNAIIGLLNDEMMSDEEDLRILATQTISKMVQHNSFIQKFNDVYLSWLKKILDKSAKVRLYWIQSLDDILNTPTENNDVTNDLINGLSKTLIDSNEKIRLATILKLQQLKKSMLLNAIINKDNNSILMTLIQLMRDKNWEIRAASISMLCKVYFDFTLQDDASGQLIINRTVVDCIPDEVLKLIYINNNTINSLLDINFFTYLLPVFDDLSIEQHLVNLLKLLSRLTVKSKPALWAILRRQLQHASALNKILDELDDEKIVSKLINWFTSTFPAEYNAAKHLTLLFQSRNKRFIRLLKLMTDPNSDSTTIVNSIKELLNKVKSDYKSDDGVNSITLLAYRSAYLIYNKSILTALIEFMNPKDQNDLLADQASDLLDYVSKINPEILKSMSDNLIEHLQDLKPVYNFINKFPNTEIADLGNYINKLKDVALNNNDTKQVKYAVRLIGKLESISIDDLIDKVLPLDVESPNLNNSLAIIGEIYLLEGESLNKYTKSITSSIASNILLSNNLMDSSEIEDEEIWLDDNLLLSPNYQYCNSKLLTLKIFTNYLRSSAKSVDSNELTKLAQPIIKLFSSIITNGGEIVSSTSDTPKNFQSRLRLEAGFQLLKLFEIEDFKNLTDLVNLSITKLIFLIQDESSQVRQSFMEKLKIKLSVGKLSMLRFCPLVFFIAHEPNLAFKTECTKWIRSNLKRLQMNNYGNALIIEKIYVRFFSLLARHAELVELTETQDFSTFNRFAMTYIIFILEQVSNEENISVLNYLTQLFKYYKLKEGEDSTVLYRTSDLTQMILKMYCTYKTWNLVSFPNKLALPIDLFDKLGLNAGVSNFKNNYLENDDKDGKLTKLIKDRFKNINFIDNELVTLDKNDVLANQEIEIENKKSKKKRRNNTTILGHLEPNHKKYHKKRHHIGDSDSEGEDDTDFKMNLKKENTEPTRKSRIKRKQIDYTVNSDIEDELD